MFWDLLVDSVPALVATALGIGGLWLHPIQETKSGGQKLSPFGWVMVALFIGSFAASVIQSKSNKKQEEIIRSKLDNSERQLQEVRSELGSAQHKLDSSEERLKGVHAQLESAQLKLDSSDSQLRTVNAQLETARKQLDASQLQLESTDRKVDSNDRKLDSTDKKLDSHNKKLDELNEKLGKLEIILVAHGKIEPKKETEIAKQYSIKARGERVFDLGKVRADYDRISREIAELEAQQGG